VKHDRSFFKKYQIYRKIVKEVYVFAIPQFFNYPGRKKWERHRQACLCLRLFKGLKESGLGEPFEKASLANTTFGLGRFISMRDMSLWTGEGW